MQPSIHLFAAAAAVCFCAFAAEPVAAQAAKARLEGSAQAVVVEPAGITAIEDLRFGAIMQPATAGTVTVDTDDSISATGGAVVGITTPQPGTRGAGRFTITGDANRMFRVSHPNRLTIFNGTASMTVDKLRSNVNGQERFDANGSYELRIGGRLQIGANQPAGDYTGTYEVTVIYH